MLKTEEFDKVLRTKPMYAVLSSWVAYSAAFGEVSAKVIECVSR